MVLVIGYGNTLRSDDGVGQRAVEAIAALHLPGILTLSFPLLTPEIAEPISRARTVVFVDAAVDAPREVQLRKLQPAESSQIMAHAADPATMLALARDVFGSAPAGWLLSIPVQDLGIGDQISEFARRNLEVAIERLKAFATRQGPGSA